MAIACAAVSAVAMVAVDSTWTRGAAWLALMVLPGLALYLALERDLDPIEAIAAALALSPVLVAAVSVPVMLAGGGAGGAARALILAAALVAVLSSLVRRYRVTSPSTRQLALLAGFALLLCAVTSFLPLTDEWWRIRSDAWAHRAYIAEIADFGVPPMDPYFVGFPLQYMWAYHVLVHTVSVATRIDPFWSMALINVQALAGLVFATFLFAGTITRSFARRIMSAVTVTLGMNAAFWLFLPIKLLRSLTGEVRGLEEVGRQLSLVPFTYRHTMQLMRIFHNKEFFLDKFMVATAFGIGLCLMAATWWAATEFLRSGRRVALVAVFLSTLGLLAFHTLVASVMLAGVLGALGVLFLIRHRITDYSLRRSISLAAVMLLALVAAAPYVYSILYSKDGVGDSSLTMAMLRLIGTSISVSFVAALALFQRWILRDRSQTSRFVVTAFAIVTACSLTIPLPASNNFDKPPFFVFFPLAVIGAWSLVDLYKRHATTAVVVSLLAFVPPTTLTIASCFNTPPDWSISDDEQNLAAWLRANTARTDILLDDDDRVPFVVLGPRRHYWGRLTFAEGWHYDRAEMSKRYHAWRTIYGTEGMDANTLRSLGSVSSQLYVVARADLHDAQTTLLKHREYFRVIYRAGNLSLLVVDKERCRQDAESGGFEDLPATDLLRELGFD